MRTTWPRMKRKRTKKRKFELSLQFFGYPFPPLDHLNNIWRTIILLALVCPVLMAPVSLLAAKALLPANRICRQ